MVKKILFRENKKDLTLHYNRRNMNKKLLVVVFMILAIGTLRSQSLIVLNPTDTLRADTSVGSASSHVIEIFTLKNNSATDTLHLNWKISLNTLSHSAVWSMCDPNLCYASTQLSNTQRYTLTPQQQGIMKFDFIPNCTPSTNAVLQVRTWATEDSVGTTKQLTWVLNVAAICTGISDIETSRIAIYPNPVRDMAHLSIPGSLDNGQIEIYNLLGSRVYSQAVRSDKDIDLSVLDAGLYIARISDSGKVIATRKFTKAE